MLGVFRKSALVAGVSLLATAALALGTGKVAVAAPAAFPSQYAAPYLELSSSSVGDMVSDRNASGVNHYTLAFLIPKSGCTAKWEDGDYQWAPSNRKSTRCRQPVATRSFPLVAPPAVNSH
ncbi:hypothetical protein [Fodinicola feengrottensis]|uniref:hypothetical protein n=1 Tax=Fodinicola feengrottensis TaxID=435914 RepID=UPI00244184E7|nr:hypothetical protein [Fodinicola feengrottensis]